MTTDIFENLRKSIIDGKGAEALRLTKEALEQQIPAKDILEKGLIPGIKTVGELFSSGQYFVPELLISGKAMLGTLVPLEPVLSKETASHTGKFLIGTAKGDMHDIGKNIVIMMLKSNGWEITDLGVDVSPHQFCSEVKNGDYDIVGISSLLTTTMPNLAKTIEALKEAGLRDKVKVMIGGAPVTQDYADKIGANAWGREAWDAVVKANSLVGKND